jgi:hypothetical protein
MTKRNTNEAVRSRDLDSPYYRAVMGGAAGSAVKRRTDLVTPKAVAPPVNIGVGRTSDAAYSPLKRISAERPRLKAESGGDFQVRSLINPVDYVEILESANFTSYTPMDPSLSTTTATIHQRASRREQEPSRIVPKPITSRMPLAERVKGASTLSSKLPGLGSVASKSYADKNSDVLTGCVTEEVNGEATVRRESMRSSAGKPEYTSMAMLKKRLNHETECKREDSHNVVCVGKQRKGFWGKAKSIFKY